MANEQNLKPIKHLSSEEAKKRGKKGGEASAAARAERKKLKDELLFLLEQGDTQEKMCLALIRQAQRGNIKAFEVVRDTIGEKAVDVGSDIDVINKNIQDLADILKTTAPDRRIPDE